MTCNHTNNHDLACDKCKQIHEEASQQLKRYRVYIAQINAQCIEVEARTGEEAREIGASKWKLGLAVVKVKSVEQVCERSEQINMTRDRMWSDFGIDPA